MIGDCIFDTRICWIELGFGKKACEKQRGIFVCEKARTRKRGIFVDHQSDGIKGISLPGQYFPVIQIASNCYPCLDISYLNFIAWTWADTQRRTQQRAHRLMWVHTYTVTWARAHTHTQTQTHSYTDIHIYEISQFLSVTHMKMHMPILTWQPSSHNHVHVTNHPCVHKCVLCLQCKLGSFRTINQ